MIPEQSKLFTEVTFSTRWGSPADITLTVSEKGWSRKQTWFWLCLGCRTLLLLEPPAILANSWLHVRRRSKYCALPQHVSLVTSLAEEKKREANRGNKLSMACFNVLMTAWELPLMTTLQRIWNISFSEWLFWSSALFFWLISWLTPLAISYWGYSHPTSGVCWDTVDRFYSISIMSEHSLQSLFLQTC